MWQIILLKVSTYQNLNLYTNKDIREWGDNEFGRYKDCCAWSTFIFLIIIQAYTKFYLLLNIGLDIKFIYIIVKPFLRIFIINIINI